LQSYCTSILTRGAESLTRKETDIRRLKGAEMRCFGSTEGKTKNRKKCPITTFHGDLLFILFWYIFLKI
jgi:hypothetical protein